MHCGIGLITRQVQEVITHHLNHSSYNHLNIKKGFWKKFFKSCLAAITVSRICQMKKIPSLHPAALKRSASVTVKTPKHKILCVNLYPNTIILTAIRSYLLEGMTNKMCHRIG